MYEVLKQGLYPKNKETFDISKDFEPKYVILDDKKALIADIKKKADA